MKFLLSAAFGAVMMAGQAIAGSAFFTIEGSPIANTLPQTFNPSPAVAGLVGGSGGTGTAIQTFDASNIVGGGLQLNGRSNLVFQFMGAEAANVNRAFEMGNFLFNENNASVGDFVSAGIANTGLIDFEFTSKKNGALISSADNGVGVVDNSAAGDPSISFVLIDSKHAYILFGDGVGDNDYDDMIVLVSAVPLPAGALLMLTGMGGMVLAARRKKRANA